MLIEGYIPQEDLSNKFDTTNLANAVRRFNGRYGDKAIITSIDGRNVAGRCEDCNKYIFGDEKFGTDLVNDVIVCLECVGKESGSPTV